MIERSCSIVSCNAVTSMILAGHHKTSLCRSDKEHPQFATRAIVATFSREENGLAFNLALDRCDIDDRKPHDGDYAWRREWLQAARRTFRVCSDLWAGLFFRK